MDLFAKTDPIAAVKAARKPTDIVRRGLDAARSAFDQEPYVACMYSTGTDSEMVLRLATSMAADGSIPRFLGAVKWDTGTGLPVTSEWGRERCESLGVQYREIPTTEDFRRIVLGLDKLPGGFPGKALHDKIQNKLKDRARGEFERQLADSGEVPTGWPIVYLSGIRADESEKRRKYAKSGPLNMNYRTRRLADGRTVRDNRPRRQIFLSPFLYVTNVQKQQIWTAGGWPKSPTYEAVGHSCECMCLCNGTPEEEVAARAFDPSWAEGRRQLEAEAREAGFDWGPGEYELAQRSADHIAEVAACAADTDPDLFDYCGACKRRAA